MRALKRLLLALSIAVLALALIEGLCSWGLFAYDVFTRPKDRGTGFLVHDTDLGWANRAGAVVPDAFGTTHHVTIDDRGFRVDPSRPAGSRRLRIACSGDSFTFGEGVGDASTWPAILARLGPDLDVLNLGVNGYGVDQIGLHYLRDGVRLDHALHVFAVIADDFARMRYDAFNAHPKPRLRKTDRGYEVVGVPVPNTAFQRSWLARHAGAVRRLRIVEAATRAEAPAVNAPQIDLGESAELAMALIEEIRRQNPAGRRMLVVFLPVEGDYRNQAFDEARSLLATALAANGIETLDVVRAMRALPAQTIASLFIQAQEAVRPDAVGHYTEAGSQFVAARIRDAITAMGLDDSK